MRPSAADAAEVDDNGCRRVEMPAYDFKCKKCSEVVEVVRPSTDDSPVTCPSCGGETKRVFSPVGVHFKGSGFYSTDNRAAPRPSPAAPSCSTPEATSACKDCPAAEPAPKADNKD
jgi:putative FmdB family regulatory protein